jgi:hypothetical protein
MGQYEFSFVITGVNLEPDTEKRISQAIGLAGVQALASAQELPDDALTVNYKTNRWWRGIPARDVTIAAKEFASREAAKVINTAPDSAV